jgi:hypothetical protein
MGLIEEHSKERYDGNGEEGKETNGSCWKEN